MYIEMQTNKQITLYNTGTVCTPLYNNNIIITELIEQIYVYDCIYQGTLTVHVYSKMHIM